MKSWAFADSAAFTISSNEAPGFPNRIFASIVLSNNKGSAKKILLDTSISFGTKPRKRSLFLTLRNDTDTRAKIADVNIFKVCPIQQHSALGWIIEPLHKLGDC